jgi:hypothetical protein
MARTRENRQAEPVQMVHVDSDLLLQARSRVVGSRTEQMCEISGRVRNRVAHVQGLHFITEGMRLGRNSIHVDDLEAANADFGRQRAGRDDDHIGNGHLHLPHHLTGPSPEDEANMARHAGETHRSVYLLMQDRGNGDMGIQARNTNGNRIRMQVHDRRTGNVYLDAPGSPHWRLEEDGSFSGQASAHEGRRAA